MQVTIIGNLGKDPELRFLPSGVGKATFTVAQTERVKGADGRWSDGDTTWIDVVAWRELAENCVESLTKGSRVVVTGKFKKRTYEKQDGSKGYAWELEAEDVGPSLKNQSARLTRVRREDRREAGLQAIGDILGGEVIKDGSGEAPF